MKREDYPKIAGVRSSDWERHKFYILPIIDELFPELQKMVKKEQITTNNRLKALEKAHNVVNKAYLEKRARESVKSTTFSEKNSSYVKINAQLLSPEKYRHHEGDYDHVSRKEAIQNNKKGKEGWMTEKPKT